MSIDAEQSARAADKKRLVAEGQLYRVGIVHAKAQVGRAVRPDMLLHSVLEHVVGLAGTRVETLLAPGGWRAAMPYILTALSFIGRKNLIKPVAGLAVTAAVIWFMRSKRQS